jgi:large subunit ribosomal protein L24
MKSTKARKQRKAYFNAPLHKKRKHIASHLEENLLLKYDRRRVTVVKGDTVKVMRGAYKSHEDKITRIYTSKNLVEIEGVTLTKADGKKVAKPIHPSNLLITKLNLTDKWRRNKLEQGLSESTKKEIEAEAKIQKKEIVEEQKRQEEIIKAQEAEASEEEQTEETEVKQKEEKPVKKEPTIKEEKEPVKKQEKPVKKEPIIKKEKPASEKKQTKTLEKTEPKVKKSVEKSVKKPVEKPKKVKKENQIKKEEEA